MSIADCKAVRASAKPLGGARSAPPAQARRSCCSFAAQSAAVGVRAWQPIRRLAGAALLAARAAAAALADADPDVGLIRW